MNVLNALMDIIWINKNCFKCNDNCLLYDGKKCKKCLNGFYSQNMNCIKCNENCLECDGTKCSKCLDGYYPKNMECIKCNEKCKEFENALIELLNALNRIPK